MGFGKTAMHAETIRVDLGREVASPHPGDRLTSGGRTFVAQGEPDRRHPKLDPALEPAARCGEANPAVTIAGARASIEKPRGRGDYVTANTKTPRSRYCPMSCQLNCIKQLFPM
jgi:hypothetical protein